MIYFESHVQQIIKSKNEEIEHLNSIIKELRSEIMYEKDRANNAVDQLIMTKNGQPITPYRKEIVVDGKKEDKVIFPNGFDLVGKEVDFQSLGIKNG